jgi:hypothetical protein
LYTQVVCNGHGPDGNECFWNLARVADSQSREINHNLRLGSSSFLSNEVEKMPASMGLDNLGFRQR